MQKKKVLFVINTLGGAGAEQALLALLRRMSSEHFECFLYVLTGQGEMIHQIPPHVKLLNDTYSDESVLSKAGRRVLRRSVLRAAFCHFAGIKNIPYVCRNAFAMLKKGRLHADKLLWRMLSDGAQISEETFDLAVAYLEGGSAYYVAEHVKAKKKAAFIHIDYGRAGYTRRLDRDCYLSFDRIFTVSDEVRQHFLEVYPECGTYTEVFHNLLDVEKIRRRAKEPGGFTDTFDGVRLLTVGRMTAQKAYEIAIDAMKLLKDEGRNVRWYVLGEGDQREMLEKKLRQLGLTNDFCLLGAVENPFPYYVQADLYVHATRFEGKSIAIQEAQVLSRPILASDCSGNREQIEHGVDGRLCELTAEGIKNEVVWMIEHPEACAQYAEKANQKILQQKEDLEKLLCLL